MATQAFLTFSDGKLEVPVEVQESMQLKDGAKLRIISASRDHLTVALNEVVRELPDWNWEPNEIWRSAQGILSDHPEHDTTKARKADREWELEHDERKFGAVAR